MRSQVHVALPKFDIISGLASAPHTDCFTDKFIVNEFSML